MSRLVILLSTLTYGTCSVGCVLLEERDDLGLLRRGAATADDRWTLTRQLHKLMLIIPQAHLQYDTDEESKHSLLDTKAPDTVL